MELLKDRVQSRGNHIHVEVDHLTDESKRNIGECLGGLGFQPDHFLTKEQIQHIFQTSLQSRGHTFSVLTTGHPPAGHWTKKYDRPSNPILRRTQRAEFVSARDAVAILMHIFQEKYHMGGYMESEHVVRYALPETASKSFVEGISIPFSLLKTSSTTKEADLHLAFGEDVDPRLIQQLTDAGLYTVLMPEEEGVKFVLTAQGTTRQIKTLMKALLGHLGAVSGAGMHASAKMEIVDHIERASDNVEISEVIESIHWISPS